MRITLWPGAGPRRSSTQVHHRPRSGSLRLLSVGWLVAAVTPATILGHGHTSAADAGGRAEIPQIASRSESAPSGGGSPALEDPVAKAKRAIEECQAKFAKVRDYTCTFIKRERVGGRLAPLHVMHMKARNNPKSIYFKFEKPNKGREAIYVAGKHGGKVLAHDVGIGRLLAGTMNLDPRGSMAMENSRHPITEAGIGVLIETIAERWAVELTAEESKVVFNPNMTIGPHRCTMIESIHPARKPHFLFHKVRLFVDREHGLPIRFEAYDWPRRPGAAPELVEEYSYLNLKVNVGLVDHDFDPENKAYSFGRF